MICPKMSGLVVLSEDKVEFHAVDCVEEKCASWNECGSPTKFQQGVDAFRNSNDAPFDISPYRKCTVEYFMWRMGWEETFNVALENDHHPRQLGCKALDE